MKEECQPSKRLGMAAALDSLPLRCRQQPLPVTQVGIKEGLCGVDGVAAYEEERVEYQKMQEKRNGDIPTSFKSGSGDIPTSVKGNVDLVKA